MAAKKTIVQPKKPVEEKKPDLAKVCRSWKTNDNVLDFELVFDKMGDPQVTVLNADTDEEVELTADLPQLEEMIQILQGVRTAAARIMHGDILPEDTANVPEDEEDEEDGDEEEDTDDN
jgi:hypothetical protein